MGFDSKNQPHMHLSLHLIVRGDGKIKKPQKISGFLGRHCGLTLSATSVRGQGEGTQNQAEGTGLGDNFKVVEV